jgi:hypothetical protein
MKINRLAMEILENSLPLRDLYFVRGALAKRTRITLRCKGWHNADPSLAERHSAWQNQELIHKRILNNILFLEVEQHGDT